MVLPAPIKLNRVSDGEYTVDARIGSSSVCYKQSVQVVIDTGSGDFWVRPNKLPWLGDRASWERAHKIKITDLETFRVEYGDKFYASCFVIDAEVRIGDVNGMQALQVPHQLIGVAEVHGGNVETTPKFRQCGLLGLSLETLRELPYNAGPSIMQNSYLATDDAGQPLANALRAFAIKVPSGTDDRGSLRGDGFIWLQASSDALATLREKYKSPLWYNGLMSRPGLMKSDIPGDRQNGFWAFWSPMYYIGGDVLQIDNVGIADTGTSQALIHPDACKALYGKIDAQYCKYENDKWYLAKGMPLDKIPAFGIAVGKCPIWIAPDDIYDHANAELVDGDWVEGTFQARQDDEDLLGAPFLKNYVAVHDMGSPPRFGVMQVPHPDGKTFWDHEVNRKFVDTNNDIITQLVK